MADNSLDQTLKQCTKCGEVKSRSQFYGTKNNKDGLRSQCRACVLLDQQLHRQPIVNRPFGPTPEGLKICMACLELKPLAEFYIRTNSKCGVRSRCIQCTRIETRKTNRKATIRYATKNKERIAEIHRAYYEKTIDRKKQYDSVRHRLRREKKWAEEGTPRPDRCEICGSDKAERNRWDALVFDHCHKTGKFRGWLCPPCNRAMGLMKDNVEALRKMIEYLEAHRAVDRKAG